MINIITLAKNDLSGLQNTYRSLGNFPLDFRWIVVTPEQDSETQEYCQKLIQRGFNLRVYIDSGTGIYEAMNLPIKDIHDEDWIWYLNAGDLSNIDSTVCDVMHSLIISDSGWAFGGHSLANNRNGILRYNPPPNVFSSDKQLFARNFVSHQAVFMKGHLIKNLSGFDVNYKVAADWDLLVRASKISRPFIVDIPIATFYLGGFSSAHRNIGNFELLKLRTVHLPHHYYFESYIWFVYRIFRNKLVTSAEKLLPDV
ncbi:MAG: hypothetical protein EB127_26605, partial [Alphaproteobacteria bacterium]|nr:hypothetical protein [Alphaproteobacteria bacterium]